jgi:hypothetical protein
VVLSIDSLKCPALIVASALQLALYLFDFLSIAGSNSDFSGEDDVQHVNECVSGDVCQFSQRGRLLGAKLKVTPSISNPGSRRQRAEVARNNQRSSR